MGCAGKREVGFLCRLLLVDPASIYRRKFSSREVLKEGIASGGNGETVAQLETGECEDVFYRAFARAHDSYSYANYLTSPA